MTTLDPRYRRVLQPFLEQLDRNERQVQEWDEPLASALQPHTDAVQRLARIPGWGVDSAQPILAEVGPTAEKFASAADLCSWVGTCPGENVTAEESASDRSPKGNQSMRRLLDPAAHAAVKAEGVVFQARYRRIRGRDPKKHNQAIWAVANNIGRVIWKVLHDAVHYEERGGRSNPRADKRRATRLLRELKALGYQVQATRRPAKVPA